MAPDMGQHSSLRMESRHSNKSQGSSLSNHKNEVLYPMVNLIPQLQKPYWKVSSLVVLQSRTQIVRAVTSPLTREILQNVEETLQFRKYFEEQLCQITNYGLIFVNHIIAERLKNACWYIYALQMKCKKANKSDR
ncbi:hypothetical protein BV898_07271 [Hypsibius exemplaris]|uniref:Uncharacterized protein n=1 Tax=Hypsibius exemplaris TaxID=2072580 RepID=A0A1W0WTW6_HYPEX|nr:hypothetical protein BV898_07271 [Hypsibius exemplaris]